MTSRTSIYLINDAADQRTGVGYEEGARLYLQMELALVLLGEALEFCGDGPTGFMQIGRCFTGHSADFKTAAHAHATDLGYARGHIEGQPGAMLPDLRVAARADMAVQTGDPQSVFGSYGDDLVEVFVPNAETRRGAADIGAVAVARAQAGVDAYRNLALRKELAVGGELMQRAGVEEHALIHQFGQVVGQLLRGDLDLVGGYAGADGPQGFVAATGVDVQARAVEDSDHSGRRAGFHRIAGGEAKGVGEGQGLLGLVFQRFLVVDKGRGPEALLDGLDLVRGEE